jgi:hypothetical protein
MKRFCLRSSQLPFYLHFLGVEINAQKVVDEAALVARAKKIHADVITLDTHD